MTSFFSPCSPAQAGAQAGTKSWTPACAGEQLMANIREDSE